MPNPALKTQSKPVDRLQILSEIGQAVGSILDRQRLFDTIYHHVGRIMDIDVFFIALRREGENVVEIPYAREGSVLLEYPDVPDGRSVTDIVFQRGQPLLFAAEEEYISFAAANGVPVLNLGDQEEMQNLNSMIFVPLRTTEETIGVLSVQSLQPNRFSQDDLQTLTIVAGQAAIAIQNSSLFAAQQRQVAELSLMKEALRQKAERLEILNEIGQALSATLDFGALYGVLFHQIQRVMDADAFYVALHRPGSDTIDLPFMHEGDQLFLEQTLPFRQSVLGTVIQRQAPLLFRTSDEYRAYIREHDLTRTSIGNPDTESPESHLFVPITVGDQVLGAMTVKSWRTNAYADDDLQILTTIAAQTGVAIENARLFAQQEAHVDELRALERALRSRAQHLEILNEVSRAISSTLDLNYVYDTICRQIGRIMDATMCFVALHHPGSPVMEVPYCWDSGILLKDREIPFDTSVTGLVVRENRAYRFSTYAELEAFLPARSLVLHALGLESTPVAESHVFVPMGVGDRIFGAIGAKSWRHDAYTDEDVQVLSTIAAQAAIAIENARLYQEQQERVDELHQTQEALRQSEEMYRSLLEQVPAVTYLGRVDASCSTIYISPEVESLLGYSPEEWCQDPETWVKLLHPDDRERMLAENAEHMQSGGHFASEYRVVARDGHVVWLHDESMATWDDQQGCWIERGIFLDISERKMHEAALRESEERFRTLAEKTPLGVCILDEDGRFETVNSSFCALLGYDRDELIGQHFTLIVAPELRDASTSMYQRDLSSHLESTAEEIALRKDGERLTVLLSSFPLAGPDGRPRRASFVLDITDRKRAELELSKRAEHDALTGLPNRLVFRDRLDQALAQASRDNDLVGLLFIDLDGFKPVNDRLGHDVGDLLLQQVAERLRQTIRHVDTVARLAGDEFTITLPSIASEQDAGMVAHKVLQAISEPYDLGAAVAQVTASIGVSIYPSDGADTDSLIKGADKAMYRAKNQGKNGVAFCSDNWIQPIAYT